MLLRTAKISDLATCAALDASYTTEVSWQIAEEYFVRGVSSEMVVGLRSVQLPRPRSVVPRDPARELEEE